MTNKVILIFLVLTGHAMANVDTAKLFVEGSFDNKSTFILNGHTLWKKAEVSSGSKLFSENNNLKQQIPPFIKNIHFVLKEKNKAKVSFTSGKKENGRYSIILRRAESVAPQLIISMQELNKELEFNFNIKDKKEVKTKMVGNDVSFVSFTAHKYTQVFHDKKGFMAYGGAAGAIDVSGIISKRGLKGLYVKFQQPKGQQIHIIFNNKGRELVHKLKSTTDEVQTLSLSVIKK